MEEDLDVRGLRSRNIRLHPRAVRGTQSGSEAGSEAGSERRSEVRSHISRQSRRSLQEQLAEAEANAEFAAREREIELEEIRIRQQAEETRLRQKAEEEELRVKRKELEQQRSLERLRRQVERASEAGSVAGTQVSRVPSITSRSPLVQNWVAEQQRQVSRGCQNSLDGNHENLELDQPLFSPNVPLITPQNENSNSQRARIPHQSHLTNLNSDNIPTQTTNPQIPANCPCQSTAPPPHGLLHEWEAYVARKSVFNLPTFSGDPSEWLNFITSYRNSNSICHFSELENIDRLNKSLTGRARESVKSLLCLPNASQEVIRMLELQYGRPIVIIHTMIEQVKKFPRISDDNLSLLVDLATKVNNLVVAIQIQKQSHFLSNYQLMDELVSKLTNTLKLQWGEKVLCSGGAIDIKEFSTWLYNKALAFTQVSSQVNKSVQRHIHVVTEPESSVNQKCDDKCAFCEKDHLLARCDAFKRLVVDDRRKWVAEKQLCFLCLGNSHRAYSCKRSKRCGTDGCRAKHHPLLHPDKKSWAGTTQVVGTSSKNATSTLLKILPVRLKGPGGEREVTALLDEGADCSLIDSKLASSLGLEGRKAPLCIQWVQGEARRDEHSEIVSLTISGLNRHSRPYHLENVRTIRNLSLPSQNITENHLMQIWPKAAKHYKVGILSPQILLGQDNWSIIQGEHTIKQSWNGLGLTRTRLGWVVHGNITKGGPVSELARPLHVCKVETSDDYLHTLVKSSFALDDYGAINASKSLSVEDERALEILNKTCRFRNNSWEVGLLWKNDQRINIDSRRCAFRRLRCVEAKMARDKLFAVQYSKKIEEYISKGYARKLTQAELNTGAQKVWYLPHLAVFNHNKPGKIRVVFDASAKVQGVSLNDQLLTGPDLYNSIPSILIRFRRGRIGFGGDIREMFLRIKIRETDQSAQRFLWRFGDISREPEVFAMQSMLFGAICSPFQAQFVRNRNASRFNDVYPKAVEAIHNAHYMDDYLDSADSVEEAVQIIKEVVHVHRSGGFEMVNWSSNSRSVLENIQSVVDITGDVSFDVNHIEKVLGLRWLPEKDIFIFRFNRDRIPVSVLNKERSPTKRELLRLVMSVFDPLGFLGWFTIKAKIILQEIWRSKIGWDDKIDQSCATKVLDWLQDLGQVETLEIPRCYSLSLPYALETQLHIFCDASDRAYAAAAYIRVVTADGITVTLIASKNRVAPLKQISVPRLELQAAVLGCRLGRSLEGEAALKFDKTWFWSDSRTVLYWLSNNECRYKMFVAHRVGEILEKSDHNCWRWVPSELNPADDATKIKKGFSEYWFGGPKFLSRGENEWPSVTLDDIIIPESRDEVLEKVNLVVSSQPSSQCLPDIYRFSNFSRLLRATSWVFRFVNILLKKRAACSHLDLHEIKRAEVEWWKQVQKENFHNEIKEIQSDKVVGKSSRLHRLSPFLDNDGVIRVRGRLENIRFTHSAMNQPVILPYHHRFVELLIEYYHKKAQHIGQELVANELRQNYWILGMRRAVRRAWSKCLRCSRERAKPFQQPMAPLPSERLDHHSKPFTNVGLDYFGPLYVTVKRTQEKRFGAIFSCLTTRAIHLEIVRDLTTDGTLLAIRRMAARRGCPKKIWSDNGTNFRGADRVLQKCFQDIDQEVIKQDLSSRGIEWHFLPPAAPHMGGSWESLIRTVKKALYVILNCRAPQEDVLVTVLSEVENVVNSRPLTVVSEDPEEPEALTPNHFLLGSSSGMKNWTKMDQQLDLRKRWQLAQSLADHFWRRWLREYLPTLVKRTKWFGEGRGIQVGQLVYMADKKTRGEWRPGRIVNTFPGRDGRTRVVDLKTREGILRRPITSLLPLLDNV